MRLNAEKERICHYREVARKSAVKYYKVLKSIVKNNLIHVVGSKASPEKAHVDSKPEKRSNQSNFYQQKETKVNCIYYITDFIKLVIENGNDFKQSHLYRVVDTLIPEELSEELLNTISIIIKEFSFSKNEFEHWIKDKSTPNKDRRKVR